MGRSTWPNYALASRQWVYSAWELHRYRIHTYIVAGPRLSWRFCLDLQGLVILHDGMSSTVILCDSEGPSPTQERSNDDSYLISLNPCRKSCPLETKTRTDVWTSTSSPSIWRITRRSCGWLSRAWTGTTMVGNVSLEKKHLTLQLGFINICMCWQVASMPRRSSSPLQNWASTSAKRTHWKYCRGLSLGRV